MKLDRRVLLANVISVASMSASIVGLSILIQDVIGFKLGFGGMMAVCFVVTAVGGWAHPKLVAACKRIGSRETPD